MVFQKTFQDYKLEGKDKITTKGKGQVIRGQAQVQSVSFVHNTMLWT